MLVYKEKRVIQNLITFKFKKENSKSNCLTFLPLPQRSATMCIRAACDINKGDEIYIAYGSDY